MLKTKYSLPRPNHCLQLLCIKLPNHVLDTNIKHHDYTCDLSQTNTLVCSINLGFNHTLPLMSLQKVIAYLYVCLLVLWQNKIHEQLLGLFNNLYIDKIMGSSLSLLIHLLSHTPIF